MAKNIDLMEEPEPEASVRDKIHVKEELQELSMICVKEEPQIIAFSTMDLLPAQEGSQDLASSPVQLLDEREESPEIEMIFVKEEPRIVEYRVKDPRDALVEPQDKSRSPVYLPGANPQDIQHPTEGQLLFKKKSLEYSIPISEISNSGSLQAMEQNNSSGSAEASGRNSRRQRCAALKKGDRGRKFEKDSLVQHLLQQVRGKPTNAESRGDAVQRHPLQCPHCEVRCTSRNRLSEHRRVHHSHKCPDCGAKYVKVANLKAHERVHLRERPYQCPQCDARFRERSALTYHLRSHTPFQCPDCGAKFGYRSSLHLHRCPRSGD